MTNLALLLREHRVWCALWDVENGERCDCGRLDAETTIALYLARPRRAPGTSGPSSFSSPGRSPLS